MHKLLVSIKPGHVKYPLVLKAYPNTLTLWMDGPARSHGLICEPVSKKSYLVYKIVIKKNDRGYWWAKINGPGLHGKKPYSYRARAKVDSRNLVRRAANIERER